LAAGLCPDPLPQIPLPVPGEEMGIRERKGRGEDEGMEEREAVHPQKSALVC